jgi:hypothetical protein
MMLGSITSRAVRAASPPHPQPAAGDGLLMPTPPEMTLKSTMASASRSDGCPGAPISGLRRVSGCKADTEREAMATSADFEEFYAATVGRLLGQLFLVTGDLHVAEEIVQEAFTRASMRWSQLRDYDVPEAWVRRVAMNLAADRARSLRRQARAILNLGPPPVVPRSTRWPSSRPCGPCRSGNARRSSCTTWPTFRSRRSPRCSPCPAERSKACLPAAGGHWRQSSGSRKRCCTPHERST